MKRPKIVALTGAGISAESGLKTFRDADGLWEGYDVMEVASIQGWHQDRAKVLDFYNMRRKQAMDAKPNAGHLALAALENSFEVVIVTQNVDNLHEKAGSTNVLHLHGELFQSRSTADESLVYDVYGWELNLGDTCEKGSQLRPNIVWFGEMVPMMDQAVREVMNADIFLVVGTSLLVYPAAGLVDFAAPEIPKYVVDPSLPSLERYDNIVGIEEPASTGMMKLNKILRSKFID